MTTRALHNIVKPNNAPSADWTLRLQVGFLPGPDRQAERKEKETHTETSHTATGDSPSLAGRQPLSGPARSMPPAGSRLIDQIEVDGKSGLTPGMAESMGAGGLAGHLLVATAVSGGVHVISESMGADVVADADRAANGIAKQLATLFAQQGWITR